MALRLGSAIKCGWIDNTTPGITLGGIELVGMQQPLKLILKGNCWRDLAGSRLDFVNPDPRLQDNILEVIHSLHRGVVGDMTASQKVKVPLISQEEFIEYLEANKEIPYEWKNSLHLEWFSLTNGRVILQTTGFELKLSGYKWELDVAGDELQRAENASALEYFMQLITHANVAESNVNDNCEQEADEFEWERRLRVRDSLEEAVEFLSPSEVNDVDAKYLLDADVVSARSSLVQMAYALQIDVRLYLGNSFLDSGSRGELAVSAQFVFDTLDEICPENCESELEAGYRIAMLKRAAEASNMAIAACNTLSLEDDGFIYLRADVFKLRDMILDRVRFLRSGDGE